MLPYRAVIGQAVPDSLPTPPSFSLSEKILILGDAAKPTDQNLVLLNHTLPEDNWTLRGQSTDEGAVGTESGLAFGYYLGGTSGDTPYFAVAGYRTGATTHEVFIRLPDDTEIVRPSPRSTGIITVWRRGDWVFASFGSVTGFSFGGNTYTGVLQFGVEHVVTEKPLAFGLYSYGRRKPDFTEARYHKLGLSEGDLHFGCSPVGHLSAPANNLMRGFGLPIGTAQTLDGVELDTINRFAGSASVLSKADYGSVTFGMVENNTKERWRVNRTRLFTFTNVPIVTTSVSPVQSQALLTITANGGTVTYSGTSPNLMVSGVAKFEYSGSIDIDAEPDEPPGHLSQTIPTTISLLATTVNPTTGLKGFEAVNAFFGSTFPETADATLEIDEQ
jgi:hypothetical protein